MPPLTLQQHIIDEQQRFPHASGEFSFLLSGITMACKIIQAKVRRAGLSDILGSVGTENIQGEEQQKLDVFANRAMIDSLAFRPSVGILASEEDEHPIVLPKLSEPAKYSVIFDPLDGSSNIDVNVSVGTTFSIFRKPDDADYQDPMPWILQPGSKQVCRGIRCVRLFNSAGIYRWQWCSRIYARSERRRFRAEPREHANAKTGRLLFSERSIPRHLSRQIQTLS